MATAAPEKLSKGKVLAGLLRQLDEVRDDRKEAMAAYKKDEQRLQNEIRRLAGDIETGQNELFDVTDETEETEMHPPDGVMEALDGLQKLAEKDGAKISMIHDGKETVIADGTKKGRKK